MDILRMTGLEWQAQTTIDNGVAIAREDFYKKSFLIIFLK